MRYNHMFAIAFTLISDDEQGEDVTKEMLQAALLRRIADLGNSDEWIEAVGTPIDTYQTDDD